jgi:hypothetical protein
VKLSGFGNLNIEWMNSDAVVVKSLSKRFRILHERKLTVYEYIVGLIKGGLMPMRNSRCSTTSALLLGAGRLSWSSDPKMMLGR